MHAKLIYIRGRFRLGKVAEPFRGLIPKKEKKAFLACQGLIKRGEAAARCLARRRTSTKTSASQNVARRRGAASRGRNHDSVAI